jgi:protein-S-isoprenylcysteine O-methyltransferase Ste14
MMIFWIVWALWCASEILLNLLLRSGDKKGQDKGSLGIIWIIITVAISSGVLLADHTPFPISHRILIPYLGLSFVVIGMILRFVAIRALGKMFTVDVTIVKNHEIKKDGIYKTIRHPSYSGSLVSFIGFGLSLNNWLSLITVTVLVTIALMYRIRVEEKMLAKQFGNEYLLYQKTTWCLFPWIY